MKFNKEYKLIIFDCDGVLVDSETITNQVLVDYLNEFGANMTLDQALKIFRGGTLLECIDFIKTNKGIKLPEEFTSNFRHRMKVAFEKDLQAVSGVKNLIESLRNLICVASNGPSEKMETTLKVTDLKKYFGKNIFSAYEIQKWKPDPDLFLYAADKMQTSPADCLVIEDSPRGVEAAKKAGMEALGYDVYGKTKELEAEGAILFKSMEDLIGKI